MPAPAELIAARIAEVRKTVRAADLEALVVVHLPNVFYLTGFAGTAGIVVIAPDTVELVVDPRYTTAARALLADRTSTATLVEVNDTYDETLAAVLHRMPAGRIGVEGAHLSVSRFNWLTAALQHGRRPVDGEDSPGRAGSTADRRPVLVPVDGIVERARIRKDAHEIATLREAARLLSEVALGELARIGAGRSERDVAADLDAAMKRAGFAGPAFDTMVASGPNSALPHARPTGRILRSGDLVVLDFGAVYDGYCVDLSRTVAIGEPDAETRRMHEAVRQAQDAAIAAVAPGVPASVVDAAAREALARQGLADRFVHGTGHGLGIEVHEAPRISKPRPSSAGGLLSPDDIIEPGMVFTVEPGVYVPGLGGIRIEDDVLVTSEGCEVLTAVPRGLVVKS